MTKSAKTHHSRLAGHLERYRYQPTLTAKLDSKRGQLFSQEVVNEIVLWKVNRYAAIPDSLLRDLHELGRLEPRQHRVGKSVVLALLQCRGVDLPMASTFLRFQNPAAFQIIDRHAFRAAFGKPYPLYPTSPPKRKAAIYFEYLDLLGELADGTDLRFEDLDRALYMFDKAENETL